MSQPFGADPNPEENPEPEEDSDWCQSRDRESTNENDQHEDPEALSEIASQAPSDSSEDVTGNGNEAAGQEGLVEGSMAPDVSVEGECSREDRPASISCAPEDEKESSCHAEGDSFEQDEVMAAPESENEVIQQTCSESDQVLIGVQVTEEVSEAESGAESSQATAAVSGNVASPAAVQMEEVNSDKPEDNSVNRTGVRSPHNFSGDVHIDASSGIDAPEDDFRVSDNNGLSAEENGVLLPESGRGSSSIDSLAIESQRGHSVEGDRDSQIPECDRNKDTDLPLESNLESNSHLNPDISDSASGGQLSIMNDACEENRTLLPKKLEDSDMDSSEIVNMSALCHTHSSIKDQPDLKLVGAHCEPQSSSCTNTQNLLSSSSPSHSESQHVHSRETVSPHKHIPVNNDCSSLPTNDSALNLNSGMDQSSSAKLSPSLSPSSSTSPLDSTVQISPSNNVSDLSPGISPISSSPDHCDNSQTSSPPNAATNAQPTMYADDSLESPSDSLLPSHTPQATSLSEASLSQQRSVKAATSTDDIQRQLALALMKDDEDDLDDIMSELDAELLSRSKGFSSHKSTAQYSQNNLKSHHNARAVNGLVEADYKQLQDHNRQLLKQLKIRDEEIKRLGQEREATMSELSDSRLERDEALSRAPSSSHNSDDLYLPQIKELENTIVQQQRDLQMTKDKLISHDTAAKKAVTTLQNELKNRVDQVTKLYEEAVKEKDSMVVMFAASESKVMDSKRAVEKLENRLREAGREREGLVSTLKAAKADKQKVVNNFEQKSSEVGNLHKEMEKLKEALSSTDYRIKWFQNKLKDELETHKETKSGLEKTTQKLKEAKEETEIIRKECQAIVKTYQESEEIKSNSLDKELKIKESQLKLHMQEWSDTEELHQRTKKELDSLKIQHRESVTLITDLKEKVHNLETTVAERDLAIGQSNELLNKQKADVTGLASKLKEKENLDEDFTRAQEMIKVLDKDVSELKINNRDLQKDMDSCRERESKMLGLQSELSRTNACLRSENTTLSNKATNLTGEVERLKMEIQELETTVRHLSDSLENDKKTNSQTLAQLKTSLDEKTKESSDFKRKWEDEIDNIKTLKRRHASNVKDLTRQLQQTKRRLETLEGSGKDSGGSMGSRTNSNGSLNSVDNSQPSAHSHCQSGNTSAPAASQEFPVITEQVEIDKQVLIERIVRLQKSHARKNEKLEFLGEHIQQLLEEIKKKTKIIQSYVMREEAGTLSSEDMDANKEQINEAYKAEVDKEMQSLLSRKGGIMASMYSVHQQDGTMTLELSLQINKKLQAVLEDTLLKNITLKENLDTLGEEIARLSQVNRKLQLHLQDLEKSKKT